MDQVIEFQERLTLEQQFMLVAIAHETKDEAVKAAALELLATLHPPKKPMGVYMPGTGYHSFRDKDFGPETGK
jgi:hypothetical protein